MSMEQITNTVTSVTNPEILGKINNSSDRPARNSELSEKLNVVPEPSTPSLKTLEADVPDATLLAAADSFNNIVDEISSRGISFTIDEGSGRTIIQVIDKNSGDIIRQVPPQEYLDMVHKLTKAADMILKDLPRFI